MTLLLLSVPCFLSAAEIRSPSAPWLTGQEAVRIGLSQPAVKQLTKGRISAALSEITEAATWPNPQLHYQYEESSPGRGSTSDAYLWLTQEFDFSGRRGLQIEAAKERAQATQEQIEFRLLGLATTIRRHFYQVLYQQALQQVLNRWIERLRAIESVIRKRQAAGLISGYDRLRLTREQAAVRARLEGKVAVYRRTWEQLLGILGKGKKKAVYRGVTGALLPEALPPLERLLQLLPRRADLQSLKQQAQAYALERQAAARGWIPNLTLSLGPRRTVSPQGSDIGIFFVAGVDLPLFDRDQAEQARAAAKAQVARSQYQLALREAQGAVRGRWQELRRLIPLAREVRRQDVTAARKLVRTAKAAYEAGEIGILALLDAYRQEAKTLIRALQLEKRARQAHIKLNQLTGGAL